MTVPATTPGPWESDATGMYYQGHVIRNNGMVVCRMLDLGYADHGDRDANARLIAAAPELYALLLLATEVLDAEGIVYGNTEQEPLDVLSGARALLARIAGDE